MHKIVSLFKRDYQGKRLVYDELMPGAEWVPAGEGVATRKYDGTCCLVRGGRLYRRYSCREGKKLPAKFELEERTDQEDRRGNQVVKLYGWVPVGDAPQEKYHREGMAATLEASAGSIDSPE